MAYRKREYQDSVEQIYRSNQPNYKAMGGFLDDDEEEEETHKKPRNTWKDKMAKEMEHEEEEGPSQSHTNAPENGEAYESRFEDGNPVCTACKKAFLLSYLFDKFVYHLCDPCCELDPAKSKLITRTEAKNTYLLKDCDIDSRKPRLKFVTKKNPHNPRWGDMRLYLRLQIEQRAIEVWGSLDNVKEEIEKKDCNREKLREKKFEKQVKELRMQMRTDLKKHKKPTNHVHDYGEEEYDSKEDLYMKTCKTCQHTLSYEKM